MNERNIRKEVNKSVDIRKKDNSGMEKRLQRQSLRLRSLLGRPHLSRFRSWDLNPANFRVVFGSLQVFWNSKLARCAFFEYNERKRKEKEGIYNGKNNCGQYV